MKLLLTLTVGDKRDNLEFVRLGGNGGVLPQCDSPPKVVDLDRMENGLLCLVCDKDVPVERGCEKGDAW